ncbi:hypothetical protein QEN19_002497 [Hanseniaspora menglaensis]
MKFSTLATTAATAASIISASEDSFFQNSFDNNLHNLPSGEGKKDHRMKLLQNIMDKLDISDYFNKNYSLGSMNLPMSINDLLYPDQKKNKGKPASSSKTNKILEDLKSSLFQATEVIKNEIKIGDNYAIRLIDHALEEEMSASSVKKEKNILDILEPNAKKYSGYFDILDEDKHFFFIFWQSRSNPEDDPTVIFMNGGPGCATVGGSNFLGVGPAFIDENMQPVYNEDAWNKHANVLVMDQPVGTGFSYSDSGEGVSDTFAAGEDFYAFIELFFTKFSHLAKNDFHISGESYAGHYIPQFSKEILSHEDRSFNLTSVMIGNGLTDPLNQYPLYHDMACGIGSGADPVVSPEECDTMLETLPRCLSLIEACYNTESVWTCVPAALYCNNAQLGPYQQTGKNVYDVRKECKGNLCYEETEYVSGFLNQRFVKEQIGIDPSQIDKEFEGCNFDINRNFLFTGDWMRPDFVEDIKFLLEEEIPVLIYAGDKDFICNWLGNLAWTNELDFASHEEYADKDLAPWYVDDIEAGQFKNAGLLTFLRIYDAGHMATWDQTHHAQAFVQDWTFNGKINQNSTFEI